MGNQKPKPLYTLSLFAALLALLVVVLGAYTRLVDAGLGCPDWPGCYGFLTVPDTTDEIALAEQRFPDAPVEEEKGWPEMVHRYAAGVLGLLILAIAVMTWRTRENNSTQPLKLSLFLLVLVICQAIFGMWTVTWKLWPQIVTTHLLGGFATFGSLVLLALRLRNYRWAVSEGEKKYLQNYRKLLFFGIFVLVIQILIGGWMSSNYAAYACYDIPTCQGSWWPQMDFSKGFNLMQSIGPNYLGGNMDNEARVAIHMAHRIGAIVATLYLIALAISMGQRGNYAPLKKTSILLLLVLSAQVLLGISNVIWHLPLAVAVAHNAGGALLLVTLIGAAYFVYTAEVAVPSNQTQSTD